MATAIDRLPAAATAATSQRKAPFPRHPALPCDRHDKCYQSCNTDRAACDEDFGNDLVAACEGVTGTYLLPLPDVPGAVREVSRRSTCMDWAGFYYAAVATAGGPRTTRARRTIAIACVDEELSFARPRVRRLLVVGASSARASPVRSGRRSGAGLVARDHACGRFLHSERSVLFPNGLVGGGLGLGAGSRRSIRLPRRAVERRRYADTAARVVDSRREEGAPRRSSVRRYRRWVPSDWSFGSRQSSSLVAGGPIWKPRAPRRRAR